MCFQKNLKNSIKDQEPKKKKYIAHIGSSKEILGDF